MTAKERQARGEKAGPTKLTADDVHAIRSKHAAGTSMAALSAEYGIVTSHVHGIVHRKWWRHI